MKKYLIHFCTALLILQSAAALATCPPTCSNDIVEVDPLFFGQVMIGDNSSSRTCTLPPGGTEACDPQLYVLNPGQFGVFRLAGFNPSGLICASVMSAATLTGTDGNTFSVDTFTFAPNIDCTTGTPQTPDASGTLWLKIGAKIHTTANITYGIIPYRGTYNLMINY